MATQTMMVTVKNGTITVDKDPVDVAFKEKPRLIWKIDPQSFQAGWRFTLDGIDIHEDPVSSRFVLDRDALLIAQVLDGLDPEMAPKVRKQLEAAYRKMRKVRMSRGKQFKNPTPMHNGKVFSWDDNNEFWDVYKYTINVTNGTTVLSWDPAIQNQGC